MLAKVFVKTPICCYIRRDCPDSGTRSTITPKSLQFLITDAIYACKDFDELFDKIDLLKNNDFLQYEVKSHYMEWIDYFFICKRKIFQNNVTPEIYETVSKIFKQHFGDDYFYPMWIFNWAHCIQLGLVAPNR